MLDGITLDPTTSFNFVLSNVINHNGRIGLNFETAATLSNQIKGATILPKGNRTTASAATLDQAPACPSNQAFSNISGCNGVSNYSNVANVVDTSVVSVDMRFIFGKSKRWSCRRLTNMLAASLQS